MVKKPIYICGSRNSPNLRGHGTILPQAHSLPLKPVAGEWNAIGKTLFRGRVPSRGTRRLAWVPPCWGGGRPMCHRMFSSMPGLCPWDARSCLPAAWSKSVCRYCQCSLGSKIARSLVDNRCSARSVRFVQILWYLDFTFFLAQTSSAT